jgi:hypothetical protein
MLWVFSANSTLRETEFHPRAEALRGAWYRPCAELRVHVRPIRLGPAMHYAQKASTAPAIVANTLTVSLPSQEKPR